MRGTACWKIWLSLMFLLSMAFSTASAAEEVIFSWDFESGQGNWNVENGVWEIGTPTADPSACHNGKCAGTVLDGLYPGGTSSRLISPAVVLPSASGPDGILLRYWQWFSYYPGDVANVQVAVWNPSTGKWSDWETRATMINVSPVWSRRDVELTDLAGKTVKIAFYHAPDNNGFVSTGWYVDDVQILKLTPTFTGNFENGWDDWSAENGVWEIGTPTADPSACHNGKCAGTVLDGLYPGGTSSRLISPAVVLPSASGPDGILLRYWQWFSYYPGDVANVQVAVWNPSTGKWSDWETRATMINVSPVWSRRDVELTDLAGKTVKIAFYHAPDNNGFVSTGWYVDDVHVDQDTDRDGVWNDQDNCILVPNPDQRDTNGDGYGNMCDGDLNNDGDTNTLDLNLYKAAHRSKLGDANYNPDADFNGDGAINTLDLNIYKGLHRKPPGPSGLVP